MPSPGPFSQIEAAPLPGTGLVHTVADYGPHLAPHLRGFNDSLVGSLLGSDGGSPVSNGPLQETPMGADAFFAP